MRWVMLVVVLACIVLAFLSRSQQNALVEAKAEAEAAKAEAAKARQDAAMAKGAAEAALAELGRFKANDGLLVQSGEIDPAGKAAEFDVNYRRPYANPPELKLTGSPFDIPSYALGEQRANGFRIRAVGKPNIGSLGSIKYEARGDPAR